MKHIKFSFENEDAATAFYLWWKKFGQEKWLEDAEHDDYTYKVRNVDTPSYDGDIDSSHAVIIREVVKLTS